MKPPPLNDGCSSQEERPDYGPSGVDGGARRDARWKHGSVMSGVSTLTSERCCEVDEQRREQSSELIFSFFLPPFGLRISQRVPLELLPFPP